MAAVIAACTTQVQLYFGAVVVNYPTFCHLPVPMRDGPRATLRLCAVLLTSSTQLLHGVQWDRRCMMGDTASSLLQGSEHGCVSGGCSKRRRHRLSSVACTGMNGTDVGDATSLTTRAVPSGHFTSTPLCCFVLHRGMVPDILSLRCLLHSPVSAALLSTASAWTYEAAA